MIRVTISWTPMPIENIQGAAPEAPRLRSQEEYMEELKEVAEGQEAILRALFPSDPSDDDAAADEKNSARMRWIVEHGETFRDLWDHDPEFKKAAAARDVSEMLRRIEGAERARRS